MASFEPRRSLRCALAVLASTVLVLANVSACSDEADSTTGRRITLKVRITGGPASTTPFSNTMGWSITLSKAAIATGELYYFDGATIFSRAVPPQSAPRRNSVFGIRTALAHPGHYVPGEARGQLLLPSSVDLHAGDAELGAGDGISGVVRSATFTFHTPAVGPLAGELGAHVAVLEGTATKASETRVFRAEIDAADVLDTKNAPAVEGCPFAETALSTDGTVTVAIGLPRWFDQVEFDDVPTSSDGKPVVMPVASRARKELARGMKAGDAYVFSYAP